MKTSVMEVHDMLSVLSVAGVEKRIGEVPGVESVTVNYAAGTATVRYDETRLEIAGIKSAVRQSGYASDEQPAGHEGHASSAAPAEPPSAASAGATSKIAPQPDKTAGSGAVVSPTPQPSPSASTVSPAASPAAPKSAPDTASGPTRHQSN